MVQIITDSTCALPPDTPPRQAARLRVVPTSVHFGHDDWVEGTFTLPEFYARLASDPTPPRSSQPPPAAFLDAFQRAAPQGHVLAMLISAALSGTVNAAQLAAAELPEGTVEVWDSGFFSSALGYMVGEALALAEAGATRADIVAQATRRRHRSSLLLTVDTLSYLRRSGRVSGLQALLATRLDIKPLIAVRQGRLEPVGRVRTRQRSLEHLVALAMREATSMAGPLWIAAMHGHAAVEAEWLLQALRSRLPVTRSYVSEVPASVALHGGPGVVGVMLTPAQP